MVDAWPLFSRVSRRRRLRKAAPPGEATRRPLEPSTPAPSGRGQSLLSPERGLAQHRLELSHGREVFGGAPSDEARAVGVPGRLPRGAARGGAPGDGRATRDRHRLVPDPAPVVASTRSLHLTKAGLGAISRAPRTHAGKHPTWCGLPRLNDITVGAAMQITLREIEGRAVPPERVSRPAVFDGRLRNREGRFRYTSCVRSTSLGEPTGEVDQWGRTL